jgi:hypothetical protein
MHVVGNFVSEDEYVISPIGNVELLSLDASKRLESCASSSSAFRTMAIERVSKAVLDRVLNLPTEATTYEETGLRRFALNVHAAILLHLAQD